MVLTDNFVKKYKSLITIRRSWNNTYMGNMIRLLSLLTNVEMRYSLILLQICIIMTGVEKDEEKIECYLKIGLHYL